jgi:ubiquitin-conjugating enzyme E2 J2
MSKSVCNDRLRKEYAAHMKKPLENIVAVPLESNILVWHYVIEGAKGTAYEGGYYHGTVTFPPEYPFKPPSIQMLTPSGRFKTNTRLCLSMSDFHPETWNPMWSVGTILMGLFSFFLEETPTHGSIVTNDTFKRRAATESLAYNCRDKIFCELFPDLVDKYEKEIKNQPTTEIDAEKSGVKTRAPQTHTDNGFASWGAIVAMIAAIIGLTWGIFKFAT